MDLGNVKNSSASKVPKKLKFLVTSSVLEKLELNSGPPGAGLDSSELNHGLTIHVVVEKS